MRKYLFMVGSLLFTQPLFSQAAPTPVQTAQIEVQRLAIVLGLSSSQQEQAVVIFTTEETALVPIRADETLAHMLLTTAIVANDAATITKVSSLLGELSGQTTLTRSTAEAELNVLLTSDQQTKYAQILAQESRGGSSNIGFTGVGPGGPPRR